MNEAYFNNAYSLFLPVTQMNQSASYFSLPEEAPEQSTVETNTTQETPQQDENSETPVVRININRNVGGY